MASGKSRSAANEVSPPIAGFAITLHAGTSLQPAALQAQDIMIFPPTRGRSFPDGAWRLRIFSQEKKHDAL